MFKKKLLGLFLYSLCLILAKEADLPLCPTNVLYFPQNLPMHCRMPTSADYLGFRRPVPTVPPFYQNVPPNKQPLPIPIPMPPGGPGPGPVSMPGPIPMPGSIPMPGPISMPGPIPMPVPMGIPGPIPVPGPIPLPGPFPIPLPGGPAHKLPVIVMPFYSPDPSFKKPEIPNMIPHPYAPRKWRIRHRGQRPLNWRDTSSIDTDLSTDISADSSTEYKDWMRNKRNHRRSNRANKIRKRNHNQKRQLLTPVLQYVTKDGYVIFEKKITKNEANDWLQVKSENGIETTTRGPPQIEDIESGEPRSKRTREKEATAKEFEEVITSRHDRPNRLKNHKNKARKNSFKPEI